MTLLAERAAPKQATERIANAARRYAPLAVGGLALAACATVALRDPREPDNYGTCPWLLVTGTHCPGCGTMRAINRLTHGDIISAAGYNIFTVLALPVMLVAYLRWAFPARFERLPNVAALPAKAIFSFLGAVVSFWILRNTPFEPFAGLAP